MGFMPQVKTTDEHHREMIAVVQQQIARACARSICEPENEKWHSVITRLLNWEERLVGDDERPEPFSRPSPFVTRAERSRPI